MPINRRFLYVGVFLVAIGTALVAVDAGGADTGARADLLRLWPLALVAIGAGLVLRRTRASLSSGVLAAAVPGLVLGGALSLAPRWVGDCGTRGEAASAETRQGTFDGPASVAVTRRCGSTIITTAPGNGRQFPPGHAAGGALNVRSSAPSPSVDVGCHQPWRVFNSRLA